jgi:hypothetical protein
MVNIKNQIGSLISVLLDLSGVYCIGDETLHLDPVAMEACLRRVIACLHFQEQVHIDTEGFFEPQSHISRNRRFAVNHIRQGGATHTKGGGGFAHGKTQSADNIFPDDFAGMGRVLHKHCSILLMIIFKVHIGYSVTFNAEGQPPVGRHGDAVLAFPSTF